MGMASLVHQMGMIRIEDGVNRAIGGLPGLRGRLQPAERARGGSMKGGVAMTTLASREGPRGVRWLCVGC